ncbi:MAG: hypothetical protein OCC45_02720 [Desulfotalea sp.]
MSEEIDFDAIITKFKADPFDYIDVYAVHTGLVNFKVEVGSEVDAVSGQWKHIPGSSLYEINRERNPKVISSSTNGTVSEIRSDLDGKFVEAGEKLMTIKHPLKKKEIIEGILKEVLYLFPAPETAKYFFALDLQGRIEKRDEKAVIVEAGDEIITMSLMKRDTPVCYDGQRGVIYSLYFKPGVSVEQGAPLIGVCPEDKLHLVEKIITRVKAEWDK